MATLAAPHSSALVVNPSLRRLATTFPSRSSRTDARRNRMLHETDPGHGDPLPTYVHTPHKKKWFIEDTLKKELGDPYKVSHLYRLWYERGFTAEIVSEELRKSSNADIGDVYASIAEGYADYVDQMQEEQK
ncbi:uncharacterized protein CCR75_007821 [Bremia lactucae]|uniref:RxLR effector protein n=1 Tax=Bremia lactucae TaxID=4779 RepID=A0A976ILZ3_BRELC|nr:hypothetical protein CCR75_007821 [Bremia lactucae]